MGNAATTKKGDSTESGLPDFWGEKWGLKGCNPGANIQDFLEKAKKVFEEKWVVNPKVSGFRHQIRPVGLFTFVFSSMGFLSHWEIFRGIFCRTLKSGSFTQNLQPTSFTCDFNILQMKQSSKLGMARFDSLCIFRKITLIWPGLRLQRVSISLS